MMKNLLFATALLSLAFATSCAVGGSGPCTANCASIALTNVSGGIENVDQAPLGGSIVITGKFVNATEAPINWSISGSSCTGSGSSNPCGYFSATTDSTATYQAPSAVPSSAGFTVTATSQADGSVSGTADFTIVHITTAVTPTGTNVGSGLTQQFTAVALPDNAPQTFTWTCTAGSSSCANFKQDSNVSGLAYYTAADSCSGGNCVKISTVSSADSAGCTVGNCTTAKASIVPSRLPTGTYAFRFSGYDSSNHPVIAAGTFSATNGTVSSGGVEDVFNPGGFTQLTITGGSYQPTSSDPNNSNNAGTLTLTTSGGTTHYLAVLDSAGDIQIVESDSNGTGSGVVEKATGSGIFNSGAQKYAFGFTGVDSGGNRVGYAGLLPIDGNGNISGGQMDLNDNGNMTSNGMCSSPCSLSGSYSYSAGTNVGSVALDASVTQDFDFFVAGGSANSSSPVNVYVISKGNTSGQVDTTHPAVVGTMVLQDGTITYNNGGFKGSSITALIGANANVSLTYGTTDGNGGFIGGFDQNSNSGTAVSVPYAPGFIYTYAAGTSANGRYTFQMLGNPTSTPVVAPLPFVLYASGNNNGFLLENDQGTGVITGTMTAQSNKVAGTFVPAAMPGTYAVATASNSLASLAPLAMNLLLTSPGNATFNVSGTQNPGGHNVSAGSFDVNFTGTGTISVTTGSGTANYVLYAVDLTHFYMMRDATKDTGTSGAILFAEE